MKMIFKKCCKCKKKKEATSENFSKDSSGTYGLCGYCKKCRSEIRRKKYNDTINRGNCFVCEKKLPKNRRRYCCDRCYKDNENNKIRRERRFITIDKGNYTIKKINRNYKVKNKRFITYKGITKEMYEWAQDIGITSSALHYRLKIHDVKYSLTTPKNNLNMLNRIIK